MCNQLYVIGSRELHVATAVVILKQIILKWHNNCYIYLKKITSRKELD